MHNYFLVFASLLLYLLCVAVTIFDTKNDQIPGGIFKKYLKNKSNERDEAILTHCTVVTWFMVISAWLARSDDQLVFNIMGLLIPVIEAFFFIPNDINAKLWRGIIYGFGCLCALLSMPSFL